MKQSNKGYDSFKSPFSWRYGSDEMRRIFSEIHYRALWRRIWVALAEAQAEYGLISPEELEDIKSKMGEENIDVERALEIEREIKHDLMAELKSYSEQCPIGGGKLHWGATSADIEDNADIIRIREAMGIVIERLLDCLEALSGLISRYKDLPCLGWTHLQPAEPMTLGYRFANYAQDLILDLGLIEYLMVEVLKGKGIKGAVGSAASFAAILSGKGKPSDMERRAMERLGIEAFPVSSQTYPRKVDFLVLSALSSIAQSAHKFGMDLRHFQSPTLGELQEPFHERQVGSSAMPFKRNPIQSERMCSLARYVSALPKIAWDNAACTIFERTLDDSANRRVILPEAFLAIDECLRLYSKILDGLAVNERAIGENLRRFGPWAGLERVLMRLVERGMNRQDAHERLRVHSQRAWRAVMEGLGNPLPDLLKGDEEISKRLSPEEVDELLDVRSHVGDCRDRCLNLLSQLEGILRRYRRGAG
ncbi:MAG: adenylosuccinate lyase [Candidatus Bathyarchaeia archaeon]